MTPKERRYRLESNKQQAHHTNRQVHIPVQYSASWHEDQQQVVKVCGDGTVQVDATGKCRVIIHTGIFDDDGVERIEIYRELEPTDSALRFARMFNFTHNFEKGRWAEVLDYDMVYQCENGELVDYVRPRKKRLRKVKALEKLRLAQVG